ncbi:MAG: ROK family protein [Candidatus Aminicenantaceae bacterium]
MTVYAGVDMGGTQLKYGIINQNNQVIWHSRVDTPEHMGGLMPLLRSLWERLQKRTPERIRAAGFGFPGIFSRREKKILQSPNYPGIDNYDLSSALSEFIRVPFIMNNDANLAAYGEFSAGGGKDCGSMVLLTIGTGVGGGVILNNRLWQGECGFAGEVGHIVVNPDGDPCLCGSRGCLEREVSGDKIAGNYLELNSDSQVRTSRHVFKKAGEGDPGAVQAFEKAGRYLGIALSILINVLNPEAIILGGGVMKAGRFLLDPALEEAERRAFTASFQCTKIREARLGNQAGFIGSAVYARDNT